MVEYHVPIELLMRLHDRTPAGVYMAEHITNILNQFNGRMKHNMNYTFLFEKESELTAFLLKWA